MRTTRTAGMLLLVLAAGCSPESLVDDGDLPSDVPDPGSTRTPAGAVAAYHGTLSKFNEAFAARYRTSVVATSAVLTDELSSDEVGAPVGVTSESIQLDSRVLPEFLEPDQEASAYSPGVQTYGLLHSVRGQAHEARGLLAGYAADSVALRGHLYALEGYADVFLADLYCSGVPLSTLDFDGDYTLRPGSTTEEVYRTAVALFDSALTFAGDSARVRELARVGKGRALLALGEYASAAAAVAEVPDGFAYGEVYNVAANARRSFAFAERTWLFTVPDGEGRNGLDYRTGSDPRATATALEPNRFGVTLFHPDRYSLTGADTVVVASGIEARLIEAEAALRAGSATWLETLNHLRRTANSPALPDTTDPGTPEARVDLLFHERAMWLYLTGHRQGDLRRLVRQYQRPQQSVYPTGSYPGGRGTYGTDVTLAIPSRERLNPHFNGCLSRGA